MAFCYPCRIFKQSLPGKADAALIKSGYNDWKHFIDHYKVKKFVFHIIIF
jgi:hypothetical protein